MVNSVPVCLSACPSSSPSLFAILPRLSLLLPPPLAIFPVILSSSCLPSFLPYYPAALYPTVSSCLSLLLLLLSSLTLSPCFPLFLPVLFFSYCALPCSHLTLLYPFDSLLPLPFPFISFCHVSVFFFVIFISCLLVLIQFAFLTCYSISVLRLSDYESSIILFLSWSFDLLN